MTPRIEKWISEIRKSTATVIRRHPIELLLSLCSTIAMIIYFESDTEPHPWLAIAVWGIMLLLVVNLLAGNTIWRRIYWVAWTPLVPLALWPGLEEWLNSDSFFISIFILTPLALLACSKAIDNRRFLSDTIIYLRAAILALLFANVALWLCEVIIWSAIYLFGHSTILQHLQFDLFLTTELFVVPTIFMMMLDRWQGREAKSSHIIEKLLNWIVSPAIIAYAALLTIYLLKIIITWTLPDGGVSYMVFAFTITALVVKAFQILIEKRRYDWFYDRFSLISLPFVALFWIGVARRIGEYGLTATRVYLIVCGAVMTVCILLFLSRRTGRYLWAVLFAILAFASVAYIPALNPQTIGLRSQKARFERMALDLALIDSTGRLRTTLIPLSDSVRLDQYDQAFDAMDYILERDTLFHQQLGIHKVEGRDEIKDRLIPWPLNPDGSYKYKATDSDEEQIVPIDYASIHLPEDARIESDPAYSSIYKIAQWCSTYANDFGNLNITVNDIHISLPGEEIIKKQLRDTGLSFEELKALDREKRIRFLDYRDQNIRIIFGYLLIDQPEAGKYHLINAYVELIMIP